jgi:RNA polymerase sigma-70 factor (ECF subfamily)
VQYKKEVAEDLTSEIFIKAFKHFDKFDSQRSFKVWIYTIAHNHLINYYRAKKETIDIGEVDYKLESSSDLRKDTDKVLDKEWLMEKLKLLKNHHRELIILRYIEELSYKEMAEILNKDQRALRVAVMRVINKLKIIINKSQ